MESFVMVEKSREIRVESFRNGGEIRVESFCNGGEIQRNPCGVLS